MKKLLKWVAILLGCVVLLIAIALGFVYFKSNAGINTVYDVTPASVTIPPADSATLALGEHIAITRGCQDCHTANLGGQVFIEDPALGTLIATNLTSGTGGVGSRYNDLDWVRGIRHGIDPDGRPLFFMPSHEYYFFSDTDLGALIAYLKQLDPVDNELPASTVGLLGRALYVAGQFPLLPAELIDHEAPRPEAPLPGLTVDYGRYMAVGCMGCHGEGFSGGPIPGVPPNWPPAANLTPHESGLADWSEEDFFALMRTGKRPDGQDINPEFMPWAPLSQMTDEEIGSIWMFLQSLPPTAKGNR